MQRRCVIAFAMLTAAWCAGGSSAPAQTQDGAAANSGAAAAPTLILTPQQRNAIYQAVSNDKSKVSPRRFPAVVGADVPPMIELHSLPDDAVAGNPTAKFFQYTIVQDQVVLVDPTKMRVVDIIGPAPQR